MVHNVDMRTSITLDEDVYEIASLYATGRGVTLGAALGELVRKGSAARPSAPAGIKTARNGLKIFAARGRKITPEMVKAAQEDSLV
jgi:hypothetical protein